MSAAIALALGMISPDASALALGRLNVQSALGEPLRAEIDVTEITAAEAENMKVNIASADAFRAAGVAYSAALADVRTSLQRRADGRYVVRLAGTRTLNEPFVDLLLEANWNSGRIVRDYTVLLDPPASRQAAAPLAPQTSSATPPQRRYAEALTAAPTVVQAAPRRQRPAPAPVEAGVSTGSGEQQVTVQAGDTASKIAGAYKPADVSLDQMLVALLRSNPSAFIGGNINRMKAGAVIDVPTAAQAAAVPASTARRTVTAQSRDFGEYRRRLAENAPTTRVASADRQASGKLQANVEDRNAAAKSPDKLTISQGTSAARAAEEKLASERQAQDGKTRVAELSKNIDDLNKLKAATGGTPAAGTPAPATAAPSASAAAPTPSAATPPAATTPAAAPPATTPPTPANASVTPTQPATPGATDATRGIAVPALVASPEASSATASPESGAPAATAGTAPKLPVKATPTPPEERGFIAELMDNPLMLGGAAIIALLIGFLLYRVMGRKRQDAGDSVFLESRMPKDSFFGASGGESVDTKQRSSSVLSSLSYSPSQLDAGDVDPVAEADVYLAYGRDLQAEEILREAMRITPERTAIHLKLLEIHAKRRDLRAYESLATEVHKLTGGSGNEWNRVVEMGKDLDPGNPLYESNVRNTSTVAAATASSADNAITIPMPLAPITTPAPVAPPAFVPSVAPLDFDLDLSNPVPPKPAAVSASLPPASARPAEPFVQTMREAPRVLPAFAAATAPLLPRDEIDLENDFDTAPAPLEPITRVAGLDGESTHPATLRANLPEDSGFIEFDMSSLGGLPRTSADTVPGRLDSLDESGESPHAVKLSLARELQALGDLEGARSLVEEVEAESSGEAKSQARQLLAQLN